MTTLPLPGPCRLVLTDQPIFRRKKTACYERKTQFALRWNELKLGVCWPVEKTSLSQRDSENDM